MIAYIGLLIFFIEQQQIYSNSFDCDIVTYPFEFLLYSFTSIPIN